MMGSGCIKNCQSLKMNATIKYKKMTAASREGAHWSLQTF